MPSPGRSGYNDGQLSFDALPAMNKYAHTDPVPLFVTGRFARVRARRDLRA
jgi:hypothetical protein